MSATTCNKCGKTFRFPASLDKYHAWCNGGKKEKTMPKNNDYNIFALAHEAGLAAANAHKPTPMHVVERANPFDDQSAIVKRYAPVMDGVCGFAWVWMKGNTAIARLAKKASEAGALSGVNYGKGYPNGITLWVTGFNQSLERKEAYARAYVATLRDAGHEAYVQSRMD